MGRRWNYLDNDWLWQQQMANGVVSSHTYNQLGQVTGLEHRNSSNVLLSSYGGMTHDGAGNRLGVSQSILSATALSGNVSYSYDAKDQVKTESRSGASGFSTGFNYDAAGNPISFKNQTRSYNAKNQLTGGTGLGSFSYDNNGNATHCAR